MLWEKAAPVLAFRVIPTILLTLITYLSIFIALIVTDALPDVPQNQGGLNIQQAYEDLRQITAHPHPYISHSNDAVRSYLLSRLTPLEDQYSHVHISNDLVSNASWYFSSTGVYFEGTNILVKIDGTSNTAGGVLFSTHYDSVATAPGSTDAGMGVATLLQLVQYFAKNRPLRTAVFNINNGEEDGMNGAHAFLEHPWANLADTFLNLEGAAAGGRPILFRAGSANPVRSFQSKHISHPHANVISSDAFARGFIRSNTDYSVYSKPRSSDPREDNAPLRSGMQGLDLAFYKGRSRYHTRYDTVPYTTGGEKSLWSMMEVAKGSGIELLNAYDTGVDQGGVSDGDAPVFFDVFKSIVFVFPINNLLTFNIAVLVLGPIILVLLVIGKRIIIARHREIESLPRSRAPHFRYFSLNPQSSDSHHQDHNGVSSVPQSGFDRLIAIWAHSKFWIALVVTWVSEVLLVYLYVVVNPFAVYSSPYIVLLSFLSLTYLSLNSVLNLPSYSLKSISTPPVQDKRVVFLHLYLFTWVLLVLTTVGITSLKPGLGGGYLMSAWNTCVGLAVVIAGVADVVAAGHEERRVVDHGTYEELEGENGNESDGEHPEPDESTPFIRYPAQSSSNRQRLRKDKGETESLTETWWWIPQFIVSVPLPVILFAQVAMLLLDAMSQTLSDGSPVVIIYALTTLIALVLVLPLSPFMSKLHRSHTLSLFILLLFILSILYTWLTFPFSSAAPMRVFFQQRVKLDLGLETVYSGGNGKASEGPVWVMTSLVGHPLYLSNSAIIPNIPSAKYASCALHKARGGLMYCEWGGGTGMRPVAGNWNGWNNDNTTEYFDASVTRLGPTSARITVKGRNTRSCRIYFGNQPIYEYVIRSSDGVGEKKGEVGTRGIMELILWSRTWDREFVVDFKWSSRTGLPMSGRVGCEWAEYESAAIDHGTGGGVSGKIPAFEEVLMYLPEWVVSSKQDDGLVEVFAPFSVGSWPGRA